MVHAAEIALLRARIESLKSNLALRVAPPEVLLESGPVIANFRSLKRDIDSLCRRIATRIARHAARTGSTTSVADHEYQLRSIVNQQLFNRVFDPFHPLLSPKANAGMKKFFSVIQEQSE
jgi:hypothetical protein